VDVLFLSEDEMELHEGADDPRPALETLAGGRLRWIVFKRGVAGGLLYDARAQRWRAWAARVEEVVDPTGAGDAFAAGLLAGWLVGEEDEVALLRGVVSASFAIEAWGPAGMLAATPEAARLRRNAWTD
jgi:ribokinase